MNLQAFTQHAVPEVPASRHENVLSRSTSAASSLDPYYLGIQSPSDSPGPSIPPSTLLSATPERKATRDPITPAKDAAVIDRRCLIGVGELATPRWARLAKNMVLDGRGDGDNYIMLPEELEVYGPDSPWTLEAMDSGPGEEDRVCPR
jgi:dual specificity tyrosine-phosphorylation-regulated kinase 2/3/4